MRAWFSSDTILMVSSLFKKQLKSVPLARKVFFSQEFCFGVRLNANNLHCKSIKKRQSDEKPFLNFWINLRVSQKFLIVEFEILMKSTKFHKFLCFQNLIDRSISLIQEYFNNFRPLFHNSHISIKLRQSTSH